jgi:2-amino-4-hydroxy-6-hydroxymethyldihydropteridine diphosphokinase
MDRTALAYVGLGSNLGDRPSNLASALERLTADGVRVLRRSDLYETAPVGVVDQPWFLNAVAELRVSLTPRALLELFKTIERDLGRRPTRRWGERVIDLDLLLYGAEEVDDPDLTVPHPELWRRLFVLVPLAELRPDLHAPDGRRIADVIADLRGSQAIRPLLPSRV